MATLTETQQTILAMVVEGKTNAQIAEKLHYTVRGIKYHLEKIYKAYRVPDKIPQIRRALLIKEVTKLELAKYM